MTPDNQLFQHSPFASLIFDPDGTIEEYNAAFRRMTGYASGELDGRNWWNLLDSRSVEPVLAAIRRVVEEPGSPVEFECRLRCRGGERVWCQGGAAAISGGDRPRIHVQLVDVTATVEIQRDLLDRVNRLDLQLREDHLKAAMALRESEERFRGLFEQAPIGMAVSDLEGRLTQVNSAFLRILGYRREDAARLTWQELRDGGALDLARLVNCVPPPAPALQSDTRFRRADGSWVDVQWNLSVVRDASGEAAFQVGQIADISRRKEDEQKLRQYATTLDQNNRDLEDFAYVASHDLQEPLRLIKSYLELLGRRYGEVLDADANEFIGFALDGATRMQKLISGLLTYSRVGTQGKSIRTVDASASFEAALANLHMAVREAGAAVTHDPLPRVRADALQLTQLFQNLIANSLKFRSRGAPRIHVSAAGTAAGWEFRVSDNGIGIEPQYAERIFQIFQRLHSQSKYTGAGIGLAICKRIVERHGGEIHVESEPGEGATFVFRLPAAAVEKPHAA